jgi:hypothetical protein
MPVPSSTGLQTLRSDKIAFVCFLYAIMKANVVLPGLLKIILAAHDDDLKEDIQKEKKQNYYLTTP